MINRMGFNNEGLEAFAAAAGASASDAAWSAPTSAPTRTLADRIGDYVTGLKRLWPHADYFTANVSSPNTPGLRDLQARAALEELLGRLAEARRGLTAEGQARPLFLKVAPDLEDAGIDDIVEVVHGERARRDHRLQHHRRAARPACALGTRPRPAGSPARR